MALLNPQQFRTLVAIGVKNKKNFCCLATSFLVGFTARNSKDPTKKRYRLFLLTNRHVFDGKDSVYLRFNKKDGKSITIEQGMFFPSGETRWLAHRNKKVDLALLNVSPEVLTRHGIDFDFFPEDVFGYYKNFKKIGICVGDEIYVIGFPLGLSGNIQNYPCAKYGILSRLDNELIKSEKYFIADASIFPGNSGGPVVLKPTNTALGGTTAVTNIYLLGVVKGYLLYEEQLYSLQSNPPRAVSLARENSGLSQIVPMDFARQIFKVWKEQNKRLEKVAKAKPQEEKQELKPQPIIEPSGGNNSASKKSA